MFNIKEILNTSLYRVKNSNLIFYFSVNPTTWKLKPTLKKVLPYADEWLYDPTLVEYKLSWLFIRISLYIETATHDSDDIYDII